MMRGGNIVSWAGNIGFLILAVAGTAIVALRGCEQDAGTTPAAATPAIVTTRALPANHLLQASDLIDSAAQAPAKPEATPTPAVASAKALGQLTGRYLVVPLAKGKKVAAKDVSERPQLMLDGGAIAIGLAVARKDVTAGTINAGTEVLACSGRTPVGTRSYVVQAVLCPASGTCTGWLRLSPAERQDGTLFGPGLAPRLSAAACDAPAG